MKVTIAPASYPDASPLSNPSALYRQAVLHYDHEDNIKDGESTEESWGFDGPTSGVFVPKPLKELEILGELREEYGRNRTFWSPGRYYWGTAVDSDDEEEGEKNEEDPNSGEQSDADVGDESYTGSWDNAVEELEREDEDVQPIDPYSLECRSYTEDSFAKLTATLKKESVLESTDKKSCSVSKAKKSPKRPDAEETAEKKYHKISCYDVDDDVRPLSEEEDLAKQLCFPAVLPTVSSKSKKPRHYYSPFDARGKFHGDDSNNVECEELGSSPGSNPWREACARKSARIFMAEALRLQAHQEPYTSLASDLDPISECLHVH